MAGRCTHHGIESEGGLMYDNVKKAAIKAVLASNPVNVLYGTVEKANPLEIRIHEKLTLTGDFLDVTEQLYKSGITKGDKVVLLRVQGGHRFLVIDRYKGVRAYGPTSR